MRQPRAPVGELRDDELSPPALPSEGDPAPQFQRAAQVLAAVEALGLVLRNALHCMCTTYVVC